MRPAVMIRNLNSIPPRFFFYNCAIIHLVILSAFVKLYSFPTGVLVLVIPRVNVLSGPYSVAYEVRVAIIADFLVTDDPAGSRVHVGFQLDYFFGKSLC